MLMQATQVLVVASIVEVSVVKKNNISIGLLKLFHCVDLQHIKHEFYP